MFRKVGIGESGHPNIVKFHGAFCVEFPSLSGKACCNLVMEWTRESLWDFMAYWHQLKLQDVKHFGTDMCMGLRHIHQFSILHRDMKPANCLLHKGFLKISGFCNSVFLTHATEQRFPYCKTLSHPTKTYRYASPEFAKRKPYGLPLDMWSVGVILWELLQEDARVPAVDFDQERKLGAFGASFD